MIVLFDSTYRVWKAVKVPASLVRGTGTHSDWVNGELIVARDSLLNHAEAEDLTNVLRATADSL